MSQSAYIIRPAESDSTLVTRPDPAVATGTTAAAWTQLTTTEQASDAISDPGAVTTTGTGLVGGTFTWVMAGDVVQTDGYQENWAGWSKSLLALYPDFDPDTDELELGLEILAMPRSTAKYGLWVGVTDTAIATRASIAGAAGCHAFPNSASNTNGGMMGATSLGSNGSPVAASSVDVTAVRSRIRWLDTTTPAVRVTGDCSRASGGDADLPAVGAIGASFSATLADWRIVVGHLHVSAVTGTPTLSARVWHRRLRTAGVPFP